MRQQPNKLLNYVLEEDEYIDNLQKIITRDFFPALGHLKQQLNDQTPNISLNNYLANFKSDENENFTRIVQDDDKAWKDKHWWISHALTNEENKQKMLMASSQDKQFIRMLQGSKQNTLAITPAEPTNALFFNNQTHIANLQLQKYDKQKKVVFENTRFEHTDKPLEYVAQIKQNNDYVLDSKLPSTPLLQGIRDEQLKKNEKYTLKNQHQQFARPNNKKRIVEEVGGYKVLTIPSPSPNAMQSPLMTYGQIEDAPSRLPEYRIPNTPQRDLLLQKLNQKIHNSKKQQKNRKESTVLRLLGSSTPTLKSSSIKLKNSSYRKDPSTVRQPNHPDVGTQSKIIAAHNNPDQESET